MQLTSPAFAAGDPIPRRHTCDGRNLSPPLAWTDAPAATQGFVLLCDDPDAPSGTWHHWALFNIPADIRALEEGLPTVATTGAMHQASNDFQKSGYGGPCPPRGHGPHHYHFRLLALDAKRLGLEPSTDCRMVEHTARGHLLAEAILIGVYER